MTFTVCFDINCACHVWILKRQETLIACHCSDNWSPPLLFVHVFFIACQEFLHDVNA